MKKIITWVLIASIISQLTGCYTFRNVELNDKSFSSESKIENKDIKIKLRSGEELISKAYNHTYNDQSGDLILGQGTIYSLEKGTSVIFGGKISKDDIDSMEIKNNFLILLLKNRDIVKIEDNKYLEMKADTTTGIILFDNMKLKIIPLEQMQSIEANEYNSTLSTITIIGVVVITVGLLVALLGKPTFNGPILGNASL